jgi:hypothetical protein
VDREFTTTALVWKALQPKLLVYVYLMVSAPADTPVTIPPELIVAAGVLTVHTPPAGVHVKVVLAPTQIGAAPVTAPTVGLAWLEMVTLSNRDPHVFDTVYFTVIVPGVSPVIIPVDPIERMPPPKGVFQVPPAGDPVSVVDAPTQRSVTV